MGNRILVVDDEKEIADVIELYLKNEGFEVEKFYTGKDALASIEKAAPDMALLDVMLPDIDGFEVLQKIREKYNFPVIMLTAKTEYMDKINGLMLGADDYMAKPFNPLELIARVKAQMRRFTKYNTGGRAQEDVIDFGNMFLNRTTHECIYNEKHLTLTPIEFDILWLLCDNRGQVISSERLFEEVWKEKYYKNSNKGYRLLGCPDIISAEEVKSRLHTDWAGCEVRYFDTLDSTNICAKRMAEEGAPNGTLVIADKQTAGRGRCGRVWETPKGTAIAMTLLMRPNLRPEKASMLTLVMGMAVTRAVNELYSLNCQIKWPNDVVWEGKKICGILVEMSAEMNAIHYLVIGCGINANMTEFPEELKEKAISLRMITGAEVDRAQIIQRSLEWLEKYYQKFEETSDMSGLMEEYNQMLVNRGSEVCVLDPCGEYRGRALGINDAGELLVEKEDGTTENVYAGEVSVRGVYGYV